MKEGKFMKKTILSFILGAMLFGSVGVFAGQYVVNPNRFPITLDGENIEIEGYNINDSTYFKLRDIASIVGGFDVDFQDDTIILNTNKSNFIESSDIIGTPDYGTTTLNIGAYNITVKEISIAPPHLRGKLYINDTFIEENVCPTTYSDGVYAYYSVDGESYNAIYKINLATLEKTELLRTNEDHIILLMKDDYLVASGDFASDIRIYNLKTNEETIIKDASLPYTKRAYDNKLYYFREDSYGQKTFYTCNLDGSNEIKLD